MKDEDSKYSPNQSEAGSSHCPIDLEKKVCIKQMVDLKVNPTHSQEILSGDSDPDGDFPLLNVVIELSKESLSEADKQMFVDPK